MLGQPDPKAVSIVLTENVGINGTHYEAGETIDNVDGALAMELAGQGKCRLVTEASLEQAASAAAAKTAKKK